MVQFLQQSTFNAKTYTYSYSRTDNDGRSTKYIKEKVDWNFEDYYYCHLGVGKIQQACIRLFVTWNLLCHQRKMTWVFLDWFSKKIVVVFNIITFIRRHQFWSETLWGDKSAKVSVFCVAVYIRRYTLHQEKEEQPLYSALITF